ncbi:type IV secretion system protein VirB8 [Enhydrobacter aerosaccus]|uniref:Type IV secretion system protein virB8 n=1 Tax=Enhydrobacter aerosaccus TaxID=225324 RepID=A0A1T4TIZ4_9HYPH|nr:type IV secretion system protein [Enhydrobacter aerosaccus]SKA40412.1 type IV secretion system protein VirB8 [Enhydrobacter aerosaccus]
MVEAVKGPEWAAYVAEASSFDDDRVQRYQRSERRAWRVAMAMTGVAVLGFLGMALLAPLKTVMPPVVVRVDQTGAVDVLTTLNGQKQVPVEDAERKYWLGKYVTFRESYTWADRAANFHAVSIMSDKREQERYAAWFAQSNAQSPQQLYGDRDWVQIDILSVALGTTPDASANVRFLKIVHERNGTTRPAERMVATVTYRFVDRPLKESDRFISARGFEVTAYRVDEEVPK